MRAALEQILGIKGLALVVALLVLFGISLPAAARWSIVQRALDYPLALSQTWPIMLIASFFNQVLPSTMGGDVVRMACCYRADIPANVAFSAVVIDRLTAFASLLLLVTLSLPIIFGIVGDTSRWWIAPLLVVCGIGCFFLLGILHRLPATAAKRRVVRAVISFSEQLSSVLLDRKCGPLALAAGLCAHVLRVVAVWVLAQGLSIEVDFLTCLSLVPLALLISMIPVSIAGWGLREGTFVAAFALVGVAATDALALSVSFGLGSIIASLPGALVWLLNPEIRRWASESRHEHHAAKVPN